MTKLFNISEIVVIVQYVLIIIKRIKHAVFFETVFRILEYVSFLRIHFFGSIKYILKNRVVLLRV